MKVIVDTCVWSLALRRKIQKADSTTTQLRELITESRAQLIGPIRQEILSGMSSIEQFELVQRYLSAFKDLGLIESDFELAAKLFNLCRKKGIQGSNTDFLICAVAMNHQMSIFTTDRDFINFSKIIPINVNQF